MSRTFYPHPKQDPTPRRRRYGWRLAECDRCGRETFCRRWEQVATFCEACCREADAEIDAIEEPVRPTPPAPTQVQVGIYATGSFPA